MEMSFAARHQTGIARRHLRMIQPHEPGSWIIRGRLSTMSGPFQSPYFLSRRIALAGRTRSRSFRRIGLRTLLSPGPALLGSVFCFVLALLFLLHSKQEIFHSPNRCVFPLKERDDREQNVQQLLDQLRVALIEFPLFDTIDEFLDLGRISGGDVIVDFHRRRSRRSYARQKRTPRRKHEYFLYHEGSLQGHETRRHPLQRKFSTSIMFDPCRSVSVKRSQRPSGDKAIPVRKVGRSSVASFFT